LEKQNSHWLGRKLLPAWEKQTPGCEANYSPSPWRNKLLLCADRKISFKLRKRTPTEMGETNFRLAGKQTTPRLGETNSFWADRKKLLFV
jgi:hypothetical protein